MNNILKQEAEEEDYTKTPPLREREIIVIQDEFGFLHLVKGENEDRDNDDSPPVVEPDFLLERHWISGSPRSWGPERNSSKRFKENWDSAEELLQHIDKVKEKKSSLCAKTGHGTDLHTNQYFFEFL